jgi:hypothetical protein
LPFIENSRCQSVGDVLSAVAYDDPRALRSMPREGPASSAGLGRSTRAPFGVWVTIGAVWWRGRERREGESTGQSGPRDSGPPSPPWEERTLGHRDADRRLCRTRQVIHLALEHLQTSAASAGRAGRRVGGGRTSSSFTRPSSRPRRRSRRQSRPCRTRSAIWARVTDGGVVPSSPLAAAAGADEDEASASAGAASSGPLPLGRTLRRRVSGLVSPVAAVEALVRSAGARRRARGGGGSKGREKAALKRREFCHLYEG